MATVKFALITDNISGYSIFDMDTQSDIGITPEVLRGYTCVKADGLYFKLPDSHDADLCKLLTDEAIIPEFEALGLERMMQKYILPSCKVKVV